MVHLLKLMEALQAATYSHLYYALTYNGNHVIKPV